MVSVDQDRSGSNTSLIKVRAMETKDDNSVLNEILLEMRKTREHLQNIEANTKDSIKEMIWYKKRIDPVTVYIRMSFVSIGDIDAVKQEFQCEFYMQVRWSEPQLMGKLDASEIDWESCWDPTVYIVDVVAFDIHERSQKLIPSEYPGEPPDVVQYFHIKGTFKEVRWNPQPGG